jgi:hypothetical protein
MILLFQAVIYAQKPIVWQKKTGIEIQNQGRRFVTPRKYLVYGLNRNNIKAVLDSAPLEFSAEAARSEPTIMEIPDANGTMTRFRIEESPILSLELAAQFPDWKTYQGYGIDDPTATARFDFTPSGFHAQILSTSGTYLIDPYQENDRKNYIVYYKRDLHNDGAAFHCLLKETIREDKLFGNWLNDAPEFTNGSQIRTYRLAIAVTGEYTNVFRQAGDTDAQAQTRALNQVTTTANRINGIYRRDFAVGLTLVSGTNLIYPNPLTDPYTNSIDSAQLNVNQTNIDTVMGSANYDVGHLFATSNNGLAALNSICTTSKARGASGQPNPQGDPFDVDYVAHEIGHQIGGNHTFNATANCGSSPASTRVEPGSAVTIMGYAGICGSTANLQRNSIDNFHILNMTEAISFITSGSGSTCGTLSGTNAPPVISALTNYTIPFNTPFALTAAATDANGDSLTYSWEQYNAGVTSSTYPSSPDDDDSATSSERPLFRPYSPAAVQQECFRA